MGNYTVVSAYLQPAQIERLKKIKNNVNAEYGVIVSISDLIRYAVDGLVRDVQNEGIEQYIRERGWS